MSQDLENPQLVVAIETDKRENAKQTANDGSIDIQISIEANTVNSKNENNQTNQKENEFDYQIQRHQSAPIISDDNNLARSISTNVQVDMKEFENDRNKEVFTSTENFDQINQPKQEILFFENHSNHSKEKEINLNNSKSDTYSENESQHSQNNEINHNENNDQKNQIVEIIQKHEATQKNSSSKLVNSPKIKQTNNNPQGEIQHDSLNKQTSFKSKGSFSKTGPVSNLGKSTPTESSRTTTNQPRDAVSKSMKMPKTARSPMMHSHRLFEKSLKSSIPEEVQNASPSKPRKKVPSRITTDESIRSTILRKRNRQRKAEDDELQEIEQNRHQLSSYNQKLAQNAIDKGYGQPKLEIYFSDDYDDSDKDEIEERPQFKYSQEPPEYIEHIRNFLISHPKSRINDPNRSKNTRK